MMSTKSLISIIIPAYNASRFLPNLLKSIDNLFYTNYELIFIDDGSKDDTLKILQNYCSKNKKAKVYHITNHGECFARDYGIAKAKGEYIYFGDADDVLHPDIFNTLIDGIVKNKSDLSICSFWPIFGGKTKIRHLKKPRKINDWKNVTGWEEIMKYYLPRSSTISFTWRKLFKHSLLKKIKTYPNIFPQDVSFCHDTIVSFNYLCQCNKISITQKKMYYYRINNQNATHNIDLKRALTISKTVDTIHNFNWSKHPQLDKYVKVACTWYACFFLTKVIKAKCTDVKLLKKYFLIYEDGIESYYHCRTYPFNLRARILLNHNKIKKAIEKIENKR